MALSTVMNNTKKQSNFFNGQTVSAYSKNNNLVEGRVLDRDGKKIIIMESSKWIPFEKCNKIKLIGQNIREAAEDDLNASIEKIDVPKVFSSNKQEEFLKLAVDSTSAKYNLSNSDKEQLTTYGKTALAAANSDVSNGSAGEKATAEKLENDLNSFNKTNNLEKDNKDDNSMTSEVSKIDEAIADYKAKKKLEITKRLKESLGDDFAESVLDDDISYEDDDLMDEDFLDTEMDYIPGEDMDGDDLDFNEPSDDDDFFDGEDIDEMEKNSLDDYDDDLLIKDMETIDYFADEIGLPPERIPDVYDDTEDLMKDGLDYEDIVDALVSEYEISVDEAEKAIEDLAYDGVDQIDDEIEQDIDDFEENEEYYDEEKLLETIANNYNIKNVDTLLKECGNIPDTIIKISDILKESYIKSETIKVLSCKINNALKLQDSTEASLKIEKAIVTNKHLSECYSKYSEMKNFVDTLYENINSKEDIKQELLSLFCKAV